MKTIQHRCLVWAGILTALVALTHLACAVFGGDWYRFLGAGEQFAQLSEQGHWYPAVVTTILSGLFLLWSLFAFSGAQLFPRLPLLRVALCLISAVFLIRWLAFVFLIPLFPDNTLIFWIISSTVCLGIGALYTIDTVQAWEALRV